MSSDNPIDYHIVKSLKQNKVSPIIKVGNDFMKDFLFDENENAIDIQITALRIIFLIHNTFNSSNEGNLLMFQGKQEARQLKLFEDEFMSEHNQYLKITIKNALISPDQNSSHLEKAIEFLTDYKKQWNTSINSEGKKIKSYGGLITMPTYEEKGHTSFLISSYWLNKIVDIDNYTYMLLQTAFSISSAKEILFLIWLGRVNLEKGTTISRKRLNERFNLNYKTAKGLCDQFLRPMRKNFDEKSMLSFNFKRSEELITIMPYSNTPKLQDISHETKDKIQVLYKLSYFKKRHNLQGTDFEKFKIVFNQKNTNNRKEIFAAYESLKNECRESKTKLTDLQGAAFLQKLQEIIIKQYKEKKQIVPNGHLVIT